MIASPITFIVGAGGSAPYHIPAGNQCHQKVRELAEADDIYQLWLASLDNRETTVRDFLEDLRGHPAESIDAFLESRQEQAVVLDAGKRLLAALMGILILRARGFSQSADTDWLGYIIEKMRKGAATWQQFIKGNASVRFVTFNFDTIIEDRLYSAVEAIYRGSNIDIAEIKAAFLVTHVHGVIPQVPTVLEPRAMESVEWVRRAASQIHIALDPSPNRGATEQAVLETRTVCFLGFAYDPDNLVKLGFVRRLKGMSRHPERYFGSAYGLQRGEQSAVRRYFHDKIELGEKEQQCREVLRALDIFED